MKPTITCCSDDELREILVADEPAATNHFTHSLLWEHVAQCERCQQRLEQHAAKQSTWQEVQNVLSTRGDELSLTADSQTPARSAASSHWQPWQLDSAETSHPSSSPTIHDRDGDHEHDGDHGGESEHRLQETLVWTSTMAQRLLDPPSHPEMLGRLGRYEVERLIGAGGMGVVFKAFDTELNRPVAIKVLAPHLAGSGAARQRFAREARAAAAVVHEHVVAIHNVETQNDRPGEPPFLVMQYVAGESLQGRLDRQGPLDLCEILRIGRQTAAGLAAAHAQGLVHRDVKPSNILLENSVERALLTDFGLARASDDASLTHSGYHPGTPQYMSPEQARGDRVDERSDLFSLGSVLYALCTGRPPFRADSSYGILRKIIDVTPRSVTELNPRIPDWFAVLFDQLLVKEPAERWSSAAELAEVFAGCLAHLQQPQSVPLPSTIADLLKARQRQIGSTKGWRTALTRPAALWGSAGLMSLLAVGAINLHWLGPSTAERTKTPSQASLGEPASPTANTPPVSTTSLHWSQVAEDLEQWSTDFDQRALEIERLWPSASPETENTVPKD